LATFKHREGGVVYMVLPVLARRLLLVAGRPGAAGLSLDKCSAQGSGVRHANHQVTGRVRPAVRVGHPDAEVGQPGSHMGGVAQSGDSNTFGVEPVE
jgi:hypothetical protein